MARDGIKGLLFRGLQTRLLANGLQGMIFSVAWKSIEEAMFKDKAKKPPSPTPAPPADGSSGPAPNSPSQMSSTPSSSRVSAASPMSPTTVYGSLHSGSVLRTPYTMPLHAHYQNTSFFFV